MREISEEEYNRLKEYEEQRKFEEELFTAFGITIFIVALFYSYNLMLNSKTLGGMIITGIITLSLTFLAFYTFIVYLIGFIKKLRKGDDKK